MMNIVHLLRKQIYEDRKGLMVYAAVVFSGLFLIGFLQALTNNIPLPYNDSGYTELFSNLLFLGGFIMTSITFAQSMYSKSRQHAWLMLPVHAHEKLIEKIIYHALIYPLALILFMTLSTLIIEGVNTLVFGRHALVFTPIDAEIWKMVLHYIILQSVFLLGAAYFRTAHFIKTVLSLIVVAMTLGLLSAFIFRITYAPYFHTMFQDPFYTDQASLMISVESEPLFRVIEVIGKTVYWFLLAPFCWTVTYFRIREVEAKDAV